MDLRMRTYLLLAIAVPTLLSLVAIHLDPVIDLDAAKRYILVWFGCLVPIYLLLYGFLFGEGYRLLKRDPPKAEIPELRYVSSRICFCAMVCCILLLYSGSMWLVGREEYIYPLYPIVPIMLFSTVSFLFRKKRRLGEHLPSTQMAAVLFISMIALIPAYCIQNQEPANDEINVQIVFDVVDVQAPMVDVQYNLNMVVEVIYVETFDTGFATFGFESDRIRSGVWMSYENLYNHEFTIAGYKSCQSYILIIDSGYTVMAINQETEEDTYALYERMADIRGVDPVDEPDNIPDELGVDEPYEEPLEARIRHRYSFLSSQRIPRAWQNSPPRSRS